MNINFITVTNRRSASNGPMAELLASFLLRIGRYLPCSSQTVATEEKLLGILRGASGRARPIFLLADSHGDQVTSEELAVELTRRIDSGTQRLIFGIGPANGWRTPALQRADRRIGFGRITLPHELAAVVAAEQIYRALTIRAGHPYHSGH